LVYCSACGAQNTEDKKFCGDCGKALPSEQSGIPEEKPVSVSHPKETEKKIYVTKDEQKKSNTVRNVIIVFIFIVIIFLGYSQLGNYSNTQERLSEGGGIIPQEQSISIVRGMITVEADNYQGYRFSVPSSASNAHISGSFTASGGWGNDIQVLIMDEEAFTNWRNGHQVNVFFTSGIITTDSFDVSVPAGEAYYIVYSNQFSLISDKDVSTTVTLFYTI